KRRSLFWGEPGGAPLPASGLRGPRGRGPLGLSAYAVRRPHRCFCPFSGDPPVGGALGPVPPSLAGRGGGAAVRRAAEDRRAGQRGVEHLGRGEDATKVGVARVDFAPAGRTKRAEELPCFRATRRRATPYDDEFAFGNFGRDTRGSQRCAKTGAQRYGIAVLKR